jgi:hypothetical protein
VQPLFTERLTSPGCGELTALRAGNNVVPPTGVATPLSGCWQTDRQSASACGLGPCGVEVRGARSGVHGGASSPISGRSNELLGHWINFDASRGALSRTGEVRLFGSHHQKFFVIRHRDSPSRDIAFVGGIDSVTAVGTTPTMRATWR